MRQASLTLVPRCCDLAVPIVAVIAKITRYDSVIVLKNYQAVYKHSGRLYERYKFSSK